MGPLTIRNGLSWLSLVLLALTVWWLLFQPFVIPTDSMYPTLDGDERYFRGDRIFANKLIYGPRIPFTSIRLWRFKDPQRWDIVVFRPVDKDAEHPVLIKRIVGLPGERVQIKDGAVYVDGERLEPPEDLHGVLHYTRYLGAYKDELMRLAIAMAFRSDVAPKTPEFRNLTQQRLMAMTGDELKNLYDQLPEWVHNTAATQFEQQVENPLKYGILPDDKYSVVPPDSYLVLGDNSPNSGDGRYFGWVPNGHILGRASCVFWPIGHAQDFTGFWHAWTGKTIIYGVPVLIVVIEFVSYLRRKRKKRAQAQ